MSQDVELYAHHLSRCPSFALTHNVITGPFRPKDLRRFRAAFSQEVRRNLFEAYLKPRGRLINLISVNANTSAALPRGEAFRFIFSPKGRTLLALSSSRIYVLDLTGPEATVRRELKTLRRPLSAAVLDDGSILAVLSTRHQINIYGLTSNGVKHHQVLVMDQPPRTIAMAQEGTVLAVAYDSAVEVFSLAVNALSTDRRAVRCEPVDSLAFTGDGSMLVGTSTSVAEGNTVIITAPFYTENDPQLTPQELHSRLWTTQILFPENSSTCQFASLLPSHTEGDAQWLVAYDHVLRTLRAVRTDDTRTGVVYFVGPRPTGIGHPYKPIIVPAASNTGDLVAAAFDNDRVYLYGVPSKIDYAPDMSHVMEREEREAVRVPMTSATVNRASLMVYSPPVSSVSSSSSEEDDLVSKVDWRQSLFVKGRRIARLKGISGVQWVETSADIAEGSIRKRLAITAPGGVDSFAEALGEESMPVDGGRLYLFDFDYSINDGDSEEVTIEVGNREPELLPEQHGNIDVEVALERRRSVMHHHDNRVNRSSLVRSATAGATTSANPTSSLDEQVHQVFRNGGSPNGESANLSRGARQLTSYLSNTRSGHVMFHRQNAQREIPHESDADNWVPPPPPYRANADTELTPELRLSMLGTFSESHRRAEEDQFTPPARAQTIPEEGEFTIAANITDLTRSSSYPRPSYRARPHSESSLSTISDLSGFRGRGNTRGSQDSVPGVVSPLSSDFRGGVVSPDSTRAGSESNISNVSESSPSLRANLTHPTSPVPVHIFPPGSDVSPQSSPGLPQPSISPQPTPVPPLPPSASTTSTPTSSPKSITLTGNNLSQRLNYPTPPLPRDSPASTMSHDESLIPPPLQPSPQPSPPSQHEQFRPPVPPTSVPDPTPPTIPIQPSLPSPPHSPSAAQTASLQQRSQPDQHWPPHRKPLPPSGHRLDPYHINPLPTHRHSTINPASATQDFGIVNRSAASSSTSDVTRLPRTTSNNSIPSRPLQQRSASQPIHSRRNRPLQPPHRRTEQGDSRRHRFNPFSSSSRKPQTYGDLASAQGGYGPHGTGPQPGQPRESPSPRPKFHRLETIQSIASNAGEMIGKAGQKGMRKGSESSRTIRDKDGRCVVM